MSKAKNFVIDGKNQVVKGDVDKLTPEEWETVQRLFNLGYSFEDHKKKRNNTKRGKDYFFSHLVEKDRKIFSDLCEKKEKGAYAKAASFGSRIIKLGKYVDANPDKKGVLDEFRELALSDFVEAKLYCDKVLSAA